MKRIIELGDKATDVFIWERNNYYKHMLVSCERAAETKWDYLINNWSAVCQTLNVIWWIDIEVCKRAGSDGWEKLIENSKIFEELCN